MADYYIRSKDDNDSRGPFDLSKLQTLAEAKQIDENTLYYDEEKEEWLPVGLNAELKAAVFPVREKLKLNIVRERPKESSTRRQRSRLAPERREKTSRGSRNCSMPPKGTRNRAAASQTNGRARRVFEARHARGFQGGGEFRARVGNNNSSHG